MDPDSPAGSWPTDPATNPATDPRGDGSGEHQNRRVAALAITALLIPLLALFVWRGGRLLDQPAVRLGLVLIITLAVATLCALYLRLLRELSGHDHAEANRLRLNRALRLLSACNGALVRADDEYALLDEICRLIVETGGYRMAWVGYADSAAGKIVRPVSQFGFEHGYLAKAHISWGDDDRGRGPTGSAIRSGIAQVNQNVLTNPAMAPWRTAALELGYSASIALPLADGETVFGALTLYSAKADAFFPEEVDLLEKLAGDLAFGVVTIRGRRRREAAEEKLAFLDAHDPLTRLPNRLLARDRFDQAAAAAERHGRHVGLLFLDIDRFSVINDSLGAELGDALLVLVVARLRDCVREGDTISRHGGDGFILLLPGLAGAHQAGELADAILAAFADPFDLAGTPVTVSFSIGVSLLPDDGGDFDTLLKCAVAAAREAKDSGRNTYRFFTENLTVDVTRTMQLRQCMAGALRNGEFVLHYQPQIDLASGAVIGAEALIRWNHPEFGMVPPAQFIPIAEDSGLIVPIGEWVIAEACRQLADWRRAGLAGLGMAVNLSAVQLKRGSLERTVAAALEASGIPAASLELELTESILITDAESMLSVLQRLKALGLRLSIDDFGTGYSSLAYLKRFKLDRLKIDQSFVRDLSADPEDMTIVRTIVHMAESLNIATIAEGVETAEALAVLRRLGCREAQGYHFAPPMPPAAFAAFVADHRRRPAADPATPPVA